MNQVKNNSYFQLTVVIVFVNRYHEFFDSGKQ